MILPEKKSEEQLRRAENGKSRIEEGQEEG